MLDDYKTGVSNPDSPWPAAGNFTPSAREALIFPSMTGEDRDDVRTHELTHGAQYPLTSGPGIRPRPNNRIVREAAEGLEGSIGEVQRGTMTAHNNYVVNPLELEAFIKGAHNVASEQGVDYSGDFDSIVEQMDSIPHDKMNPNIRGLLHFLRATGDGFGNAWRDDQKEYIQQAFNGVAQYKDMDENFTPSNRAVRRQQNLEDRLEKTRGGAHPGERWSEKQQTYVPWLERSKEDRRAQRLRPKYDDIDYGY
tara:strand:- start:325 stop:1080 length:756 start_codon:yes stop_codon:yes gene_type:complete